MERQDTSYCTRIVLRTMFFVKLLYSYVAINLKFYEKILCMAMPIHIVEQITGGYSCCAKGYSLDALPACSLECINYLVS